MNKNNKYKIVVFSILIIFTIFYSVLVLTNDIGMTTYNKFRAGDFCSINNGDCCDENLVFNFEGYGGGIYPGDSNGRICR